MIVITTVISFLACVALVIASPVSADDRPNILLLLTDDQDVTLGSFDHMPKTQKLLQEEGMTFDNAFVHTPICCPSRSSILSGRYLHNGAARNNSLIGNCYGKNWKEHMETQHTYALHARRAGYTTAYAGKYLNRYGELNTTAPPGWDHWLGLVGNSRYYNYSLIEGGIGKRAKKSWHGDQYAVDYLPNVLRNYTLEKISTMREPWLMVVAWPTPHGPFTPAPWAKGTMSDYYPPMTQNYNASDLYMRQKHWLMRQLLPMTRKTEKQVEKYYQMRLEALKSIDQHVEDMVTQLETLQQLEKTVILYTSDNGFQFGQHRLAMDKRHLYENDIRVPFCIRGPKIVPSSRSSHIVANIDIAPTILDITTATTISSSSTEEKASMDGTSFWRYIQGQPDETFTKRHDLLITYHGEGQQPCGMADCPPPLHSIWWMPDSFNNTYNCVRTIRPDKEDSIYCRFEDDEHFVEFYDLINNPYQLHNDYVDLEVFERQRYERRLQELMKCKGSTCRVQ